MNQTQQELTYYKALRTAWTKQARVLESATKTLDKIIKKMEREEPRFLLDKDSICYGCPEYKNIMDCDLTDPWNHWGEGDENGGVCDDRSQGRTGRHGRGADDDRCLRGVRGGIDRPPGFDGPGCETLHARVAHGQKR